MLNMTGGWLGDGEGKNGRKTWTAMIIDSAIIGFIAMAASMPAVIPTQDDMWIMFKAFFGAFILQLAVERGLKRASQNQGQTP